MAASQSGSHRNQQTTVLGSKPESGGWHALSPRRACFSAASRPSKTQGVPPSRAFAGLERLPLKLPLPFPHDLHRLGFFESAAGYQERYQFLRRFDSPLADGERHAPM